MFVSAGQVLLEEGCAAYKAADRAQHILSEQEARGQDQTRSQHDRCHRV